MNSLNPNDENTLSCETLNEISHRDIQRFKSTDTITTQIKAKTKPTVKVNNQNITVSLKEKFLDINECMDVQVLTDSTYSYVYFTTGKYYNCSDNTELNTYVLNGNVPSWAKVDQEISINGQTRTIETIEYHAGLNATVIKIPKLTLNTSYKANVYYDYSEYNVYEFDVNMSGRSLFSVTIYADSQKFVSEEILVDDFMKNYVVLEWWMEGRNTDMYYATGIKNKAYLHITNVGLQLDNTNEVYKTDTGVVQIDENNYEVDVFDFDAVSKEVARKIVLALTHNVIYINDIRYNLKSQEASQVEKTNLYTVQANLYRTFSNGIAHNKDVDYNASAPRLIVGGNVNFISQ